MKKTLFVLVTIALALAIVYLPELFQSGRPVTNNSSVKSPDTIANTVQKVVKIEPEKKKENAEPAVSPTGRQEKAKGRTLTLAQIKTKLNESSLTGTWTTFQEIEQSLSQFPDGSENYELSKKVSVIKRIVALKGIYCKAIRNQVGKSVSSKTSSEIQKIVFEQIQNCLITGLLSDDQSNSVSSWLQNPICQ
jgi:hypothetical protein